MPDQSTGRTSVLASPLPTHDRSRVLEAVPHYDGNYSKTLIPNYNIKSMHGTTLRPFFSQAAPAALGQLKEIRDTLAKAAGEASAVNGPVDPSELSGGRTGRSGSIKADAKGAAKGTSAKKGGGIEVKAEVVNNQL